MILFDEYEFQINAILLQVNISEFKLLFGLIMYSLLAVKIEYL
jgi:hypothetical protein